VDQDQGLLWILRTPHKDDLPVIPGGSRLVFTELDAAVRVLVVGVAADRFDRRRIAEYAAWEKRYIRNFPLLLSLVGGFLLFGLLNGGFAVLPMYTMKYKLAPSC
jgi:hypothetical protein